MEEQKPVEDIEQIEPTVSTQPKSINWLLIGLIIALIVILSSVGTYLFVNNSNLKSQNSRLRQDFGGQAKLNPSPTIDPTANWKTYTNTKYGFEIKYPNGWNLKSNSYYEIIISTEKHHEAEIKCKSDQQKMIEKGESFGPSPCRFGIYISIRDKLVRKDTDIWEYKDYPLLEFPNAFQIEGEYLGPNLSIGFPLPKDNKKFINLENYILLKDNPRIFNQTLSTFKFLGNQTIDTSNWKTYTDEKYQFEFRYPPNWKIDQYKNSSFVQFQEIKNEEVTAITGGITIIDKSISSNYSKYKKIFTSNTKCPEETGRIDLSDTVNVYCLTGKDIQTSNDIWKGVVECSESQFYGLKVKPETCPHQFWIDTKDFFYIVHFNFFEPIIKGSKDEIFFNQILSTFKFMDQNEILDTSNWKTYTNTKYGFEIKYPNGWNIKSNSYYEIIISTEKHNQAQKECQQQEIIEGTEGRGTCRFGTYISIRNKLARKDSEIWEYRDYPLAKFPNAFEIVGEYGGPTLSIGIPLPNNDKKFVSLEGYIYKDDIPFFNQILSTFRFD